MHGSKKLLNETFIWQVHATNVTTWTNKWNNIKGKRHDQASFKQPPVKRGNKST